MNVATIGLAALLAGMVPPAAACGYCVEDKVAAAYDHAVVARARTLGHQVVYLSLEFTRPVNHDTAGKISRAIERIALVDRGSVRVALDAGSLSLAFDAKQAPAVAILDEVERVLAPLGAHTALLLPSATSRL